MLLDIVADIYGALHMLRAAVIVFLLALLPAHARAEARIALLVGNEAYKSEIGRLANPHNDVALLEQTLKGLGFEVIAVHDAGLGDLTRAVNGYARRLQAAGQGAIGFFYYSGHGASDGSTNYLIPVDVKTTDTGELWDQSLQLTEITRKLKKDAGQATHFVVFDACRNTLKLTDPRSRAVVLSKGFIPATQENGMLIAYATAEGELASDVGAGAGPYAKVLAEEIVKPGIEAVVMFRAVQRRVRVAIRQEPYLGFNALGDVYIAGPPSIAPPAPQPLSEAAREWAGVDKSNVADLETFIRRHATSTEADYARGRLTGLKKHVAVTGEATSQSSEAERAWAAIKDTASVSILEDFIKKFGSTVYGSMARARLDELKKSTPTNLTAASLRGHWRVNTSCYAGTDNVTFDIRETSATEFSGEYNGENKIVRGRIDGNRISITTQAIFTVTWTGTVSRSGSLLQMHGSYTPGATTFLGGNCTFTATKH